MELLSITTLAAALDVKEPTIRKWIHDRQDPLPYYKLGKLVRFKMDEVSVWVNRRAVKPIKNSMVYEAKLTKPVLK